MQSTKLLLMSIIGQAPRPYGQSTPPEMTLSIEAQCDFTVSLDIVSDVFGAGSGFYPGDTGTMTITLENNVNAFVQVVMPEVVSGLILTYPWENFYPVVEPGVPFQITAGYEVTGETDDPVTFTFVGCPPDYTVQIGTAPQPDLPVTDGLVRFWDMSRATPEGVTDTVAGQRILFNQSLDPSQQLLIEPPTVEGRFDKTALFMRSETNGNRLGTFEGGFVLPNDVGYTVIICGYTGMDYAVDASMSQNVDVIVSDSGPSYGPAWSAGLNQLQYNGQSIRGPGGAVDVADGDDHRNDCWTGFTVDKDDDNFVAYLDGSNMGSSGVSNYTGAVWNDLGTVNSYTNLRFFLGFIAVYDRPLTPAEMALFDPFIRDVWYGENV